MPENSPPVRASVIPEGDTVVIRLPRDDVHSLRVALAECPCRAPKSTATQSIRVRLNKALGRALSRPNAPKE